MHQKCISVITFSVISGNLQRDWILWGTNNIQKIWCFLFMGRLIIVGQHSMKSLFCLPLCLNVCPSVHLSVCLSVWPSITNLSQDWIISFFWYCTWLQYCSLLFLEIAHNDSLQQFLTSSRGKTPEKRFWDPRLDQNWAWN